MQRLFDGVHILEGEVNGRPLWLMYLLGPDASLLLDTGCAPDPHRFIAPQIRDADGDPSALTWIVNTHPDLDHTGGNHAMKQLAPGATLACGDADRATCESFDNLMRLRYDEHRKPHHIFYPDAALPAMRSSGNAHQPIDLTFTGGERIRLGDGWDMHVLHVPGHSKGHLALLDVKHRALYGGDALHGAVDLGLNGEPLLCPTYLDVDDYLATIHLIEGMAERGEIDTYVGCHWPLMRGPAIAAFCAESRGFVELADRLLLELLTQPMGLREICVTLGPKLGNWPRGVDMELAYCLNGHVERLTRRGALRCTVNADGLHLYETKR